MIRRDDLLIGSKDSAIETVKAGRKENAVDAVEELYRYFRPLHDRYSEWIQSLLCFTAEKLGEETVEKSLQSTFKDAYQDILVAASHFGA